MTTTSPDNPDYCLDLARELIQQASVTPADAGCLDLIGSALKDYGFTEERLSFGEVSNIWLRYGTAKPLLCFLGHVDVVPTGPVQQWRYPPFDATVADGFLWGRGAADMKSGVAAMVSACRRFVAAHPDFDGSIALLLTSDEEGPAVDGVAKVVDWLKDNDQIPDWTLVGEPSAIATAGDRVRVGRRGSLHAHLRARGLQGHVAYPDKVRNPIHALSPFLAALVAEDWSRGESDFPATSLQLTQIQAGTGALNVVPGDLRLHFNLRFSPSLEVAEIQRRVDELLAQWVPPETGVEVEVQWKLAAVPFHSPAGGDLRSAVCEAVASVTGRDPELSTGGGTSDGRFMAPLGSEVVELGPCVDSIHQIDERVSLSDLQVVEQCYVETLKRLFKAD